MLSVLERASLELSLSASADIRRDGDELEKHGQRRLERAGYEKDQAARQYHAVEPENRLVARELEKRWEPSLLEDRTLPEDYARFKRQRPTELTEADQAMIRALAEDIPQLWRSPPTTSADRQSMVRHIIERVTVTPQTSMNDAVDVTLHFAGGFISHHELRRSVARYDQMHDYAQLLVDRHNEICGYVRTAPSRSRLGSQRRDPQNGLCRTTSISFH